jgi:hypothetical protein
MQEETKYTQEFREAKALCEKKQKQYRDLYDLGDGRITSDEHPAFFEFDKVWREKRKMLDMPILKKAKYKIGDKLQFMKKSYYFENNYSSSNERLILSNGIVVSIHTSDCGSGQIVYCFDKLDPPCPEINPFCLEADVLSVLKSENKEKVEQKTNDGYVFGDLLKKINSLTEENAQSLLNTIYPDTNSFVRQELRMPVASSYRNRLIKNLLELNDWHCFKKIRTSSRG